MSRLKRYVALPIVILDKPNMRYCVEDWEADVPKSGQRPRVEGSERKTYAQAKALAHKLNKQNVKPRKKAA